MPVHPRVRAAAATLLFLALTACGGGGDPAPADIAGTWALPSTVPGSSLQFTLAEQGSTITGSGEVSIEAGFRGVVDVVGTVQDRTVTLTLHYGDGTVITFNGTATSRIEMDGTFTSQAGQAPAQFVRLGT